MPDFYALPYNDQERKMEMKKAIGINGIPHLWILSGQTGYTLYTDGGDQLAGELPRELYQKWLSHQAFVDDAESKRLVSASSNQDEESKSEASHSVTK